MNENIFRKKSIDKISSPEKLNDYMKVANPSTWIILASIIVILIGACVWGVVGKLQTKVDAVAVVENGSIVCYLNEDSISKVKVGMEAIVNDQTCQVVSVDTQPGKYVLSEYAMHVGSFQTGEFLFKVTLSGNVSDGTYKASIVTESISPMKFLTN